MSSSHWQLFSVPSDQWEVVDSDDGDAILDRWLGLLQQHFPESLSHLVWDRSRVAQLERAVDHVIQLDGRCPPHLIPYYRRSLVNRLTGLGPLDALLLDDSISEVMVNGPDVYVERHGRLEKAPTTFADSEEVQDLARRVASRAGRDLTTETPLCDALLSDGSRVQCVLPPVSEQPCLTIRKAQQRPLTLEDYLQQQSLTEELWQDLVRYVHERQNLVIAGGASSGKTSLLRLLASAIHGTERLITIEDVRELNLPHPNTVRLEAYRHYSLGQLVMHALRMRPDRIIVGEVRGAEALDLIEALSSGHPGSLCTLHSAGGDMRTIHRLARLALQKANGLSFDALVSQILETIDVIVYLVREPSGRRRVDRVVEIHHRELKLKWCWAGDRHVRVEEGSQCPP
jgi:pilus assembly protein CpaF